MAGEFGLFVPGDTQVPVDYEVARIGVGGVGSLTVNYEIRNAATNNSYLDFNDNTFKTSGWTTKTKTLAAVPGATGRYRDLWNSSLAAAIIDGFKVVIEIAIPSGAQALIDSFTYDFRDEGSGGGGGGPTAAQIADAVWDEILSGHAISGSTGEALSLAAAGGGATPSAIADAVLEELLSGHTTPGSLAAAITAILASTASIFGDGSISVGTDYGSTDNLRYQTSGAVDVDNAVVRAYLKSDWDGGNFGEQFVKGRTITNVAGKFVAPLMLDAETYILMYEKQNEYGPNTVELTVS